MAGIIEYITSSYDELTNHVTWPPYAEAQRLTVIVLVFSVVLALAIWGVDSIFSSLVEEYFKWVKS